MSSSSGAFWTKELVDLSLGRIATRFLTWYRAEFFALFSPATIAWMLDRGDRKLVLNASNQLRFAESGQGGPTAPITSDELLASSLEAALARRGVSRKTTKVVLELPKEAFFVRRFDVPVAVQATLPRLLNAEIERKTPFRQADVVFGFIAAPIPDNSEKLRVEQWILRRDLIDRGLDGVGLKLDELDFVEPEWPHGAATAAPSIAIGQRPDSSNWFRNAALGLLALAAVLFATGCAVTFMRQERLGEELDAKIADMSGRAARVRQMADRATAESGLLTTLRQERKHYPALADIWEEISRLLPDSANLEELRLSEARAGERVVDLSGFAESAVGLPALFDRSRLFSDAALTAPITPDVREKREMFALQMKVKRTDGAPSK